MKSTSPLSLSDRFSYLLPHKKKGNFRAEDRLTRQALFVANDAGAAAFILSVNIVDVFGA